MEEEVKKKIFESGWVNGYMHGIIHGINIYNCLSSWPFWASTQQQQAYVKTIDCIAASFYNGWISPISPEEKYEQ